MENFEQKFMLFMERCDQAYIPANSQNMAFYIMLMESSIKYYFEFLKYKNFYLKGLGNAVEKCFQTPERTVIFSES